MRKTILTLAMVFAFGMMPNQKAHAAIPGSFATLAAPSFAAVSTTLLPAVLFALAAENVDPWTPVFGAEHVFYEYPQGMNSHAPKIGYVPVSAAVTARPVGLHGATAPYHVIVNGQDTIQQDYF